MAALHNRAHGQARLTPASAAGQDASARGDAERFAHDAAIRAGETILPTDFSQIGGACCVVGEKSLKFRERLRERQIGASNDVHDHMPVVGPLSTQTHGAKPHLEQTIFRTNFGFNSKP